MPSSVCIHVFQGNCTELLPRMCMFCGNALDEDDFQQVPVLIGNGPVRPIALPVCRRDRLPARTLYPDGRGPTSDAVTTAALTVAFGVVGAAVAQNLIRHQEGLQARFTFNDVHNHFAAELDRIRRMTPKQYDAMMVEANNRFIAKLHAQGPTTAEDAAQREAKVQQEAEDVAMFGIEGAASVSDVSVEVTRSNRNKFLIVGAIVGIVSVLLVMCIATSVIGYMILDRGPAPEDPAKKRQQAIEPPKEMAARIKDVDVGSNSIKLLVGTGKYQTLTVTDQTEFRDAAGQPLPGGLATMEQHKDADVTILHTDDRQGLRWLKLK